MSGWFLRVFLGLAASLFARREPSPGTGKAPLSSRVEPRADSRWESRRIPESKTPRRVRLGQVLSMVSFPFSDQSVTEATTLAQRSAGPSQMVSQSPSRYELIQILWHHNGCPLIFRSSTERWSRPRLPTKSWSKFAPPKAQFVAWHSSKFSASWQSRSTLRSGETR